MTLFSCSCSQSLAAILRSLDRIEAAVARLEKEGTRMQGDLDALTAEVARNTTVEKSALALIKGFAQQLQDAGTDPAKLDALAASLTANDDELAAAVAANTPAAGPNPGATSQTA